MPRKKNQNDYAGASDDPRSASSCASRSVTSSCSPSATASALVAVSATEAAARKNAGSFSPSISAGLISSNRRRAFSRSAVAARSVSVADCGFQRWPRAICVRYSTRWKGARLPRKGAACFALDLLRQLHGLYRFATRDEPRPKCEHSALKPPLCCPSLVESVDSSELALHRGVVYHRGVFEQRRARST